MMRSVGVRARRTACRRGGGAAALALLAGLALAPGASAGQPGTVTGGKVVGATDIGCNGSTKVTLTLNGQTGIAGDPADIVLVLDRSGSMTAAMAAMKSGANQFVDIIDQGTDGALNGVIANGSRVGVVSFADNATVNQPLTGSAGAVKAAVNALGASGGTNHEAAINTAQAQLAGGSTNDIMIIFTDGETTVGGDASNEAAAARAAGTEIFAIGLGSVDGAELADWATDPNSSHLFITPSPAQLNAIFQSIGAAVVVPAATGITVVDTVNGHFAASGAAVSKGTLGQSGNVLTWTIPALQTESVTLTYTVTHDPAKAGGVEQVSDSVTYSDNQGRTVTFPSPAVRVHGCAATIDLTPPTATNELGTPGQTHTVNAAVKDDFGDPINGVPVTFSILSGPNAAATGSGTTASGTGTNFTYTATQGPAGLGQDVIQGCFTNGAGASVCDTAAKNWVDTTAPTVQCAATTNPSGGNVPSAGGNPKSGQNPDGFYVLTSSDAVDPNPTIRIADTGSSATFGPFPAGTKIKLTQAPGATPGQKPGPGSIDWHITLKGDALVTATDASGNTSAPVSCLVPPRPA